MQFLQKEETEHITINDDNLVVQLARHNTDGFWKRGARLVGIVLTSITVLAFLIYGIIFYCQNILFYRGELNINQFGAFTPNKSYCSEYAMFLFDTSEKWVSSGIQVQKGDRLFISASGAFHSNYVQLVKSATKNTLVDTIYVDSIDTVSQHKDTIRSRWIFYPRTYPLDGKVTEDDIANTAYQNVVNSSPELPSLFGDVLFQVVPEYQISNKNYSKDSCIYRIPYTKESRHLLFRHIDFRAPIEVNQDGILAFMVNDKKPENNIGQILVVMEIFRKSEDYDLNISTFKKMIYRWLDLPYYHYELIRHKGLPICAALIYWILTIIKLAFFCIFAYCLPLVVYYIFYFVLHPKKEYYRLKVKVKKMHQKNKQIIVKYYKLSKL